MYFFFFLGEWGYWYSRGHIARAFYPKKSEPYSRETPCDSLVESQPTSIRTEMESVIPFFSKNFFHSAIVVETGVCSISSCISYEDTKSTNKNPAVELDYNQFSVGPSSYYEMYKMCKNFPTIFIHPITTDLGLQS